MCNTTLVVRLSVPIAPANVPFDMFLPFSLFHADTVIYFSIDSMHQNYSDISGRKTSLVPAVKSGNGTNSFVKEAKV